jgi:SAM-dependent methyltransferase
MPSPVSMDRRLVKYYRTAENYRRYLVEDAERLAALSQFFHRYWRYFGRSVLDLGCGGGVLGAVLRATRRQYLGVDANPDMIREARRAAGASGPRHRFLRGNIVQARIRGRFDTVTLLGNALGHLSILEMDELLRQRKSNVHRGSTFLTGYRDVVGMFWRGTWSRRPYVQTHKRGTVVSRTRSVNLQEGLIHIRARPGSGGWTVDFTHSIWSPFILEGMMRSHGWKLLKRDPGYAPNGKVEPDQWVDVYRFYEDA